MSVVKKILVSLALLALVFVVSQPASGCVYCQSGVCTDATWWGQCACADTATCITNPATGIQTCINRCRAEGLPCGDGVSSGSGECDGPLAPIFDSSEMKHPEGVWRLAGESLREGSPEWVVATVEEYDADSDWHRTQTWIPVETTRGFAAVSFQADYTATGDAVAAEVYLYDLRSGRVFQYRSWTAHEMRSDMAGVAHAGGAIKIDDDATLHGQRGWALAEAMIPGTLAQYRLGARDAELAVFGGGDVEGLRAAEVVHGCAGARLKPLDE